LLLVLAFAAGCNDEGVTGPTAPPPETAAPTAPTTTDNSTTVATTAADTGPATTAKAALPTVSTIIPQVSAPLDPNDRNNRLAPPDTPEEIAIITAYIEAGDRANTFYSIFPRDPDDPLLLEGPFTPERIERDLAGAADDNELRQTLDVSGGITYRPYITGYSLGDSEAIVFDCQLDATVWRNADSGEVVPPPNDSYPNTGPDVASPTGVVAKLLLADGRWLVDSVSSDPRACQ
jgi:hypothetical protein